jgi:septum site-determining protein MinC
MALADPNKAFELEGMVTALGVLRVLTPDLAAITAAIDQKIASSPVLFRGAALVLDFTALDREEGAEVRPSLRIGPLLELLRARGLVPVGVRGATGARLEEATAAGLGQFETQTHKAQRPTKNELVPEPQAAAAPPKRDPSSAPPPDAGSRPSKPSSGARAANQEHVAAHGALMLTQPLRAGQIVHATERDAVVLATVNAGAELIADGNIHVYGTLRGRALAGARGDEHARIFCQRLEADLISIAGVYLSSEELPEDKRGKPAQISLHHGELVIDELVPR